MKKHAILLFALLFFVSILAIAGCGRRPIKTEQVEGNITLDGKPLAFADVTFSPKVKENGHPAYGQTDDSGHYKLQTFLGSPDAGTTPGEYVVCVTKIGAVPTGRMIPNPDGPPIKEMQERSVVPALYTSPQMSPFTATVVQGKNQFDFDLDSKAK